MKSSKLLILALAVASLAACGGGGGGGASPGGGSSPTENSDAGNTPSDTGAIVDTGNADSITPLDPDTSTNPETPDLADNDATPDQESTDPGATDNSEMPVEETSVPLISLSWSIPATREDGSYLPVYEIGGYEVRYSKDEGTDVTVIRIDDPQTTDWTMENLAPGLYEFSIATIDSEGVYSEFSTTATAQIE
jgi:hypothetical protein